MKERPVLCKPVPGEMTEQEKLKPDCSIIQIKQQKWAF